MSLPPPTATPSAPPAHRRHRGIRWRDLLALAGGSVGANKLRSSLTVLGITIGVFSVVSVMTALSAIKSNIDSGLAVLGANVFEISRYPGIMVGGDGWWNYRNRPPISYAESMRFKELMDEQGFKVTIHVSDGGERATYGKNRTNRNKTIVGTNEHYVFTHNLILEAGRNLTDDDVRLNRPVTVIGQEIARELFPNENPLGKSIRLDGQRSLVIGLLAGKGEIFGQSQDNLALIPVSRFRASNWNWRRSAQIAVQAPDQAQFDVTMDTAIGLMRLVRGLEPEDRNDFEVYSNDSLQRTFDRIARIIGTGGLLISVIALITAGVGIMNIMLVSVTERTREIGVRKSIGARPVDILRQFLIEAIFLSESGAAFGILLGVAAGNIVAHFLGVDLLIPWFWVIMAVVVCSLIGLVFGIYPAWKAARLDPVVALRFE